MMHCNTTYDAAQAGRPGFTPLTVGLTILGFLIAWPLGVAALAYVFFGHRIRGFAEGLRAGFREKTGFGGWRDAAETVRRSGAFAERTGNAAFDEYRRREMERLDAERRRLDQERREFETYVRDLQRARDQQEFDRFMEERRRRQDGPTTA
ncbi:DUF2852 domain-containing protein [Prosthecodimorpha staleyi]|jgi:hypothetical protein|nr:DUF2852 domain-containing protein [Prosthecodimorpha staleyi]